MGLLQQGGVDWLAGVGLAPAVLAGLPRPSAPPLRPLLLAARLAEGPPLEEPLLPLLEEASGSWETVLGWVAWARSVAGAPWRQAASAPGALADAP